MVGDDTTWRRETVRTGHDGEVYLPTLLPVDEDGAVVAPGDLAGQYAYCLQRADQLLQRAGLSLAHVVSTADYTTPAAGAGPDRDRRGPARVAGPGVPQRHERGDGADCTSRACSSRSRSWPAATSTMPSTPVGPGHDTLDLPPGTRAGNTLYLSGFTGIDQQTRRARARR